MNGFSAPFRFETFGLQIWRGLAAPMRRRHSHTEIELNLVLHGSVTYRFAEKPVTLHPGRLYVFGGLTPHLLEHGAPGTRFYYVTVPLEAFIRWRLPDNVTTPILGGEMLMDQDDLDDERRFARWLEDLQGGHPRRARVTLPEVQGRLERMALSPQLKTAWRRRDDRGRQMAEMGTLTRIESMLHTIAERYREPLTLGVLAEKTQWHPRYAATQFRRWIGLPPGEFVLRQRVAHARYLLATSDLKVIDIGEECGFASQSSFYAAFLRLVGHPPGGYRRTLSGSELTPASSS
ncbi:MAG TPA: helix-turn-helix domain-containing protein [Opitutaceae bacterium]|jgi:AraC-like DNA-binding protein|nr:helix-turn-helix domain-containing protein [Opitutaceae bacterium]